MAIRTISEWSTSTTESKKLAFEGAHRGLLGRFGVVPAADVERPVGDEEAQLVGRRPADVAGVPAPPGLRLLDRALDRDDDVTEMGQAAWRERKGRCGSPRSEHLGGQQRE